MPKKKKQAEVAADTTASAAGAGTGTGVGTGTKTSTKEKPVVTVHAKLANLIRQHDAAAQKAGSLLVEMGEMVQAEHISNAQLILTIMEVRGIEQKSAASQASRIRALLKDTEQFEALKRGDVTVRAGVKAAQSRRVASPLSKQKAFDSTLAKFAEAAKALGQSKTSILATVEAKLDEAKIK